jgi:hypothetical protein
MTCFLVRRLGDTLRMAENWSPPLQVYECAGRCRLSMGGWVEGQGDTLQDAADDLVARVLNIAICFQTSGFRFSSELGPPDHRLLAFLWDLGELAARGEDIRERLFGTQRVA